MALNDPVLVVDRMQGADGVDAYSEWVATDTAGNPILYQAKTVLAHNNAVWFARRPTYEEPSSTAADWKVWIDGSGAAADREAAAAAARQTAEDREAVAGAKADIDEAVPVVTQSRTDVLVARDTTVQSAQQVASDRGVVTSARTDTLAARTDAVNAAGTVSAAKAAAEQAASDASNAAGSAIAASNSFRTIALGEAATTDGQFFSVPKTDGTGIDLYERTSSGSTWIGTFPNLAAINAVLARSRQTFAGPYGDHDIFRTVSRATGRVVAATPAFFVGFALTFAGAFGDHDVSRTVSGASGNVLKGEAPSPELAALDTSAFSRAGNSFAGAYGDHDTYRTVSATSGNVVAVTAPPAEDTSSGSGTTTAAPAALGFPEIGDDGTLYVAGPGGTRVDLGIATKFARIAIAGDRYLGITLAGDPVVISADGKQLFPASQLDFLLFMMIGQSLPAGQDGTPLLLTSTAYPADNLMFQAIRSDLGTPGQDVSDVRAGRYAGNIPGQSGNAGREYLDPDWLIGFVPHVAREGLEPGQGETPLEGFAEFYHAAKVAAGGSGKTLSYTPAQGGAGYATIQKGGDKIWTNSVRAATKGVVLAAPKSLHLRMPIALLYHGQTGEGDPTYKDFPFRCLNDLNDDFLPILGQTERIKLLTIQPSSFATTSNGEAARAHLQAWRDHPTEIFCVGPDALGPQSDYYHKTPFGYQCVSLMFLRAYLSIMATGSWTPLCFDLGAGLQLQGNKLYVPYHVREGRRLALRTDLISQRTGTLYGYSAQTITTAPPAMTDIKVYDAKTLEVTLAGHPAAPFLFQSAMIGRVDDTGGAEMIADEPRSNLFDDDPLQHPNGRALPCQACHEQVTITV